MNDRIYKFPLEITDEQFITAPKDSVPLSVQFQKRQLCLWMIKGTSVPTLFKVYIVGTGNPFDKTNKKFVGTAQELDGRLVWHIFTE